MRRYYEFRSEDIVRVCLSHHAEIHSIYDELIAEDLAQTGVPLYLYSWKQATVLMARLRHACDRWLLEETPGIDSAIYERRKKARRTRLKNKALARRSPEAAASATARSRRLRRRRKKRGR